MRLMLQARSNPLAWWWGSLTLVSNANILVWFMLYRAFRSFLPRADVQRICLFDTWLSSVFVGRSVATVAELCFAAQWAIILAQLGAMRGADTTLTIAWVIVPLIVVAECLSWYA